MSGHGKNGVVIGNHALHKDSSSNTGNSVSLERNREPRNGRRARARCANDLNGKLPLQWVAVVTQRSALRYGPHARSGAFLACVAPRPQFSSSTRPDTHRFS